MLERAYKFILCLDTESKIPTAAEWEQDPVSSGNGVPPAGCPQPWPHCQKGPELVTSTLASDTLVGLFKANGLRVSWGLQQIRGWESQAFRGGNDGWSHIFFSSVTSAPGMEPHADGDAQKCVLGYILPFTHHWCLHYLMSIFRHLLYASLPGGDNSQTYKTSWCRLNCVSQKDILKS